MTASLPMTAGFVRMDLWFSFYMSKSVPNAVLIYMEIKIFVSLGDRKESLNMSWQYRKTKTMLDSISKKILGEQLRSIMPNSQHKTHHLILMHRTSSKVDLMDSETEATDLMLVV